MYVPRFLQPLIAEHMTDAPVVIVEGARAVGKTSLLRELRETGQISASFSLTDETQLAAASENPLAWLRSLPRPFAIDEAQLLPGLPVALKALLDETNESVQCVLTGSAAIGLTGLGGTDPLARRAVRLTLEPLTEAEILAPGKPWSVIDQLFDGVPAIGVAAPLPTSWEDKALLGGLPRYRLMYADRPKSVLSRRIDQDIRALLTDDVLPGEKKDFRIALDVLTHLLMHPGGEMNATAISRSIGIDTRTVNRYIDILERRFLLHELPNFHRPSKKSPRSTAKGYPTDTALSAAVLLATDRRMTEATTRGGMMEAHVVQQIKAHLGWAETRATLTHWRQNKNGRTSEVDLVLQDAAGRLVAIEIKASGTASSSHFKGIREFRNYYGARFHRGFVITTGEQPVVFDDNLWALPLSSLSNLNLWKTSSEEPDQTVTTTGRKPTPLEQKTEAMRALKEARIFVSYSHQDQNSSTGGDIRQFATDIVDALEGLYGRTVELFLDVNDVRWGEDLWSRIDNELESSTFLLPFITPRYLKSDPCRREFVSFSEAAQRTGSEQLLLPLMWITPPALSASPSADPIINRLESVLYIDVAAARRADRGSAQYSGLVEEVAGRLEQVLTDRETAAMSATKAAPTSDKPADEPETGLDEYLARAEELMPDVEAKLQTFMQDYDLLGTEFKQVSVGMHAQRPAQLRAAMTLMGKRLEQPNKRLTDSAGEAARVWDELITSLNRGMSLYSEINPDAAPHDLKQTLESILGQLEDLDTSELEGIAQQMPKMSSKLVPTSKALLSAVGTLRSMEESLRSWLSAVNEK